MDSLQFQLELLKNLHTAVVVHAPDTQIIYSNKRASEILGLSEDQMRGKLAIDPAWCFINEQGITMELDNYPVNRVVSSRQPFDNLVLGILVPQRTGPTWVLVSAFPGFDLNGELTEVVVNFHDITEHKKVEQELRRSEAAFKGTFNQAAVGIAHVGTDGTWLRVNKKLCDIVGYSEDELVKLTFQDVTYPEDLSTDLDHMKQMLTGEIATYSTEKRYYRKSGDLIWVKLTASIVRKEDGRPDYFISVFEDISERMQMKALLVNEHERSNIILNTVIEPIFVKDNCHRFVFANRAFCELFGVDKESVLGKTLMEHVPAGEWNEFVAADRRVLDTGMIDQSEETLTLRGATRVVFTTKTRFVDNFGERYVVASSQDITEQKELEKEDRIAATAFNSQEGITVTDADGTILKVNPAFTRITGYSSEEAVGRNPRLLKSGRQRKDFYALMWDQIRRTGSWEGEIWNRRKSGEIYPEYLTITAVKNSEGVVTNYVGTFNDITLIKASADEIKNLAFYDPLTKLPNRRLLLDRLPKALATIARSGNKGALLFLDLDNFKNLNDTLGHDIGDLLLQQVAERLTACVREGDTVARLGGDEFVLMIEGLSKKDIEAAAQAEIIANNILSALNRPYQLATTAYQNSPSIGITLLRHDGQEIDELLKQADIAMYQAKKEGRNTMRFFDPKMQESLKARIELDQGLRNALNERQFQLYFQIQVDNLNHPVGAEALIRWQHPEWGLTAPADFIPHAEDSGLIWHIGDWVLESACELLKAWQQDALTRDLVLSINVSAKQFQQPAFVTHIIDRIKHHDINPRRLMLELTESILLKDIEDIIFKMRMLKEFGLQLSLDDFGTGYSSLQYLKRLPLKQLKIDKSFICDIETDTDDRSIVSTIIAMASTLNVEVIAEGVETEEQRGFLAERNCRLFQGYLFGRPMPIEQLEALLKQG